ncbi:MAG TPA: CsbD family protein [Pirellulales bacterium]|nr:CsbD family protein [Pirellulales bacterium]
MVSQQTLKGDWNEVAGKLRSKWGQLNNDEMQEFKGNATQLVGYIQRKTGEAKDKIERFLNNLTEDGADSVSRMAGAAKDFASQAVQSAKDGAETVVDQARAGYAAAERIVQERPATSIAAALGGGFVIGILLSLLLRSER